MKVYTWVHGIKVQANNKEEAKERLESRVKGVLLSLKGIEEHEIIEVEDK